MVIETCDSNGFKTIIIRHMRGSTAIGVGMLHRVTVIPRFI